MNIKLRDPKEIMKLSRLGSFHQSKLSFLRSFLSEFKNWEFKRDLFNLDEKGFGESVYSFKNKDRVVEEVVIRFKMPNKNKKYHFPIILSPNAYSTWWSEGE